MGRLQYGTSLSPGLSPRSLWPALLAQSRPPPDGPADASWAWARTGSRLRACTRTRPWACSRAWTCSGTRRRAAAGAAGRARQSAGTVDFRRRRPPSRRTRSAWPRCGSLSHAPAGMEARPGARWKRGRALAGCTPRQLAPMHPNADTTNRGRAAIVLPPATGTSAFRVRRAYSSRRPRAARCRSPRPACPPRGTRSGNS